MDLKWEASPHYTIATLPPQALERVAREREPLPDRGVDVFVVKKRKGGEAVWMQPYLVMPSIDRILTDALALPLSSPEITKEGKQALLTFVRQWGRLGVGIQGAPDFPCDEVFRVYAELKRFQAWVRAYDCLKRGKFGDQRLEDFFPYQLITEQHRKLSPALASLRSLKPGQYVKRRDYYQQALPPRLTRHLEFLHAQGFFHGLFPAVAYDPRRGFRTGFRIPNGTLFDALWLGLWARQLDGLPPQVCEECGEVFSPTRKGQRFCSRRCQNRVTQRDHYARVRGEQRKARKQ